MGTKSDLELDNRFLHTVVVELPTLKIGRNNSNKNYNCILFTTFFSIQRKYESTLSPHLL